MNDEKFTNFLFELYNIGYLKVIPIICGFGLILNILSFIIFLNPSLKEKCYFYLMIKSFVDILMQSTGIFLPFTADLDQHSYVRTLISLIIYKYLRNFFCLFGIIMEIVISLNRYSAIKSKEKMLSITRNGKLGILFLGILSGLIKTPILFAFKIVHLSTDHFRLVYSGFGKSIETYLNCINVLENLLSILILLPLNIVVLKAYKKFIAKKSIIKFIIVTHPANSINKQNNPAKSSQNRFTKMIIIISFVFIWARLCQVIISLFTMYHRYIKKLNDYDDYIVIMHVFVELNIYLVIAINFPLFYFFNKKFRDCFRKTFFHKDIKL